MNRSWVRTLAAIAVSATVGAACSGGGSADAEFVSRSGPSVLHTGSADSDPVQSQDSVAPTEGAGSASATTDETGAISRSGQGALSTEGACAPVEGESGGPGDVLTAATGLDSALVGMRGHAVAAGDVNGDGFVDLFVGGFADRPIDTYQVRGADGPAPDRLLLGSVDGFTIDAGFPETFGRTSGAAFADLDEDGDLDLIVARNPRNGERAEAPSEILENDSGTFRSATVLDSERGLRSIAVLDFDADGLNDLFVVEDRFTGGDSLMLRNEGGFRFSDVTAAVGLPAGVAGLGVATADFDSSGTPDLFVAGDNRLFSNQGGEFVEVDGPFAWTFFGAEDDPAGVAVGDVDGNGWLDLVVGQHFNSTLEFGQVVPVRLYLNRGPGASGHPEFEDATEAAGLAAFPTKAPHVELVDIDGDGAIDIVTSASASDGSGPAILLNQGGSPPQFSQPEGLGAAQYWVAGAVIDVDADPDPEIFMVEWEPALGSQLWEGPDERGGFLTVQVGPTGAEGIGATVEVRDQAGGLVAHVPIVASTGYGSGSEPVARIGVGGNDTVDVHIRLPGLASPLVLDGVPTGVRAIVQMDGTWSCR